MVRVRESCLMLVLFVHFSISAWGQQPAAPPTLAGDASTPPAPTNTLQSTHQQSSIDGLENRIKALEASVNLSKNMNSHSDRITANQHQLNKIYWAAGLLSIVSVSSLYALYNSLKKYARGELKKQNAEEMDKALEALEKGVQERTSESLSTLVSDFKQLDEKQKKTLLSQLQSFGNQISDMVVLHRALENRRFDEAVAAIQWDGRQNSLRAYPVELRKLAIKAIVNTSNGDAALRSLAWEEAESIFSQSSNEANLAFLYELAYDADDRKRGYDYFKRFGKSTPMLQNVKGASSLAALLRHDAHVKEGLQVIEDFKGERTSQLSQLRGHFLTNLGRFDEADEELSGQVKHVLTCRVDELPEKWGHVLYSYLLNCMASGEPEKGLRSARFALKAGADSLLLLGILRLAIHLDAKGRHEDCEELIVNVKHRFDQLPEDVASVQAEAIMAVKDNPDRRQDAVDNLKETIKRVEAGDIGGYNQERSTYFLTCLIGELLIEGNEESRGRAALREVIQDDKVGQASFLYSRSYARQNHFEEAFDYLERASRIHNRWRLISKVRELYPEFTLLEQPKPST